MKKLVMLSVLVLLTFAMGCRPGAQVVNLQNLTITTASQQAMSQESVRKAIVAGCVTAGWTAREVSAGNIEAQILVRGKHSVAVDIPYTTSTYSILYKSSSNMEYNGASETIHPNYNSWVNNLRNSIDKQIVASNMQ